MSTARIQTSGGSGCSDRRPWPTAPVRSISRALQRLRVTNLRSIPDAAFAALEKHFGERKPLGTYPYQKKGIYGIDVWSHGQIVSGNLISCSIENTFR